MTSEAVFDRFCENCGKQLPSGKRKDAKYCNDLCGNRVRGRRHYLRHPEEYRAKRLRENSDIKKRLLSRIKSKCRKQEIPFNLEPSDIKIPEECPVLKIPLYSFSGSGANNPHSPSVDRIDPEKGYTKGNIRVISMRANLLKSNAKIWELSAVLKDMVKLNDDYGCF